MIWEMAHERFLHPPVRHNVLLVTQPYSQVLNYDSTLRQNGVASAKHIYECGTL